MNLAAKERAFGDDFQSKDGKWVVFSSPTWKLSRDVTIYWNSNFERLGEDISRSIRKVIANIAENKSASHAANCQQRFLHFSRYLIQNAWDGQNICYPDVLNYRKSLPEKAEWYVTTLRGLFKTWEKLKEPGISQNLNVKLAKIKLRGNEKGRAIRLRSATEGAFTDFEFEVIRHALVSGFEEGDISLRDLVIAELFICTGRRPKQLCELRHCDLVVVNSDDGLVESFLKIPRAKERGGEFRGSFKLYALADETALIIERLIDSNRQRLDLEGVRIANEHFPLFPNWSKVRALKSRQAASKKTDDFTSDFLHLTTQWMRSRLHTTLSKLNLVSETTGQPLRIFPTRFRRTLATRAAREGYGPLVIAELLDHSDTQNATIYTENVPEHLDAIEAAVSNQMAIYAQAFSGAIVSRESDAVRGEIPESRIRSAKGDALGTCGENGFCSARPPIACYTCSRFQPWLHAPHESYLKDLLEEEARVAKITGDTTISAINLRPIIAIKAVIEKCAERLASIAGGSDA